MSSPLPVQNTEYNKLTGQKVEWRVGIHDGTGTVESVRYCPFIKKDVANVRVSDNMVELVDCDVIRPKA